MLAAWLLLWILAFKRRFILATPLSAAVWESTGETTVQLAAALTLFAAAPHRLRVMAGTRGLRIASSLYGLSLIAFGAAHFTYAKLTASLVPAWLPAHMAWVDFTGAAYIAAGLAILFGPLARLAATLSAVQIALLTLLVWGPAVATRGATHDQWSEAAVSWTITVSACVVAAAYAETPWLGDRKRGRGD
jgi:uncharacterized membrane protein